jgi:soluble lytic murein transglycosylase-like protein
MGKQMTFAFRPDGRSCDTVLSPVPRSFRQPTAFPPCAITLRFTLLQTPLQYKLFNSAAASVAILILYGTVAAVALQEPAARPARTEPRIPTNAVVTVPPPLPFATPKVPTSTLGQIAAPTAAVAPATARRVPSQFQREQNMSHAQLMKRWEPIIKNAAKRFGVPTSWIREVMRIESGGRTMMAENARIVSSQGALGLMQVQPGTYSEMRAQYGLGPDPFDPHDNIFAGAAYLRWLRGKYGYPAMFEAYDDGPGNLEQRSAKGVLLPTEARNYVSVIAVALGEKPPVFGVPIPAIATTNRGAVSAERPITFSTSCAFTRSDGSPLVVDCSQVTSVRTPPVEDNSPQTQSIVTSGSVDQRVRESEEVARQLVLSHGGHL